MLTVKTSAEAEQIIKDNFGAISMSEESVDVLDSVGRILAEDIKASEDVPGFNRSTVDGYAVCASDTFGCSESIPALLDYKGEVKMGEAPKFSIGKYQCAYVPTGGELPEGADAMVMIEYAEDYGDGTRAMLKPSAPGQHVTYKGDDVKCGEVVVPKGTMVEPRHVASMAALGYGTVKVYRKPVIGVISTGDELVDITETPKGAEVRDINSFEICATLKKMGCDCKRYGIVRDDIPTLRATIEDALATCDAVVTSGGSSVGVKDATFRVYDELGAVLFHGIAIKPGKPTIAANIDGKPAFGLPGHPLAAFYVFNIFVKPIINSMAGYSSKNETVKATLMRAIPCNHGREECVGIKLHETEAGLVAEPAFTKSGLISVLAKTDGYIRISRDCEGLSQGDEVEVELF